jgi:hypothetical protein
MKINNKIEETNVETLSEIVFDLVITSSGYESRAIFLDSKYKLLGKKKLVVAFDNYQNEEIRLQNDKYFDNVGYEKILASGNIDTDILNWIKDTELQGNINILIDYSCMTRVWYSGIIKHFAHLEKEGLSCVNLYFSYTQSVYSPPPKSSIPNKYVQPINNYYGISSPQKPTALIIGLGNENIRAFGLKELFDAEPYLFYTDPSMSNPYTADVESSHRELLSLTPDDKIFKYPLHNINYLHFVLNLLCKILIHNHKVVIAPCGPKPFVLAALVNSFLLPDTSVWRISPGELALPFDHKPSGNVYIAKLTLTSKVEKIN